MATPPLKSKPWMQSVQESETDCLTEMPMGAIPAAEATELHAINAVMSHQLIQGMLAIVMPAIQSIVARDSIFEWARSQDPRVGSKQRKAIMESLQTHGGVWDEARSSPLSRHGKSGQIAADSLYDARSRLLAEFNSHRKTRPIG